MNTVLAQYLWESSFTFCLLYLTYKLLLSRNTFFTANRFFLLLIIPASLMFPILEIPQQYEYTQFQIMLPEINTVTPATTSSFNMMPVMLYLAISGIFLALLCIKMVKLIRYISMLKKEKAEQFNPFSFFRFIYIPKNLDSEQYELIYKHEAIHAKQLHSIDLLIYELYRVFFWFNPLTWLALKDVKSNHEYLADRSASQSNINSYSNLMVAQLLGVNCSDIANNFNDEPLIKKRMKMMKTKQTQKSMALIYVLALPVMMVAFFTVGNPNAIAQETPLIQQNEPEKIYDLVDQMPEFKGGTEKLFDFVLQNLKYPKEASSGGKVFVSFVINTTGKVEQVKLEKGADPLLDQEALRVIKSMPDWVPGKHEGKVVNVKMVLPIAFEPR